MHQTTFRMAAHGRSTIRMLMNDGIKIPRSWNPTIHTLDRNRASVRHRFPTMALDSLIL